MIPLSVAPHRDLFLSAVLILYVPGSDTLVCPLDSLTYATDGTVTAVAQSCAPDGIFHNGFEESP